MGTVYIGLTERLVLAGSQLCPGAKDQSQGSSATHHTHSTDVLDFGKHAMGVT